MPELSRIIEILIGALLTFILGIISKQLEQIKKNRIEHEAAYKELMSGFNTLQDKMTDLNRSVKTAEMKSSRYRIIRFDDEEQSGIEHSDDHWDQILEDIDIYCSFCNKPENSWFQNHKGKAAMDRIVEANKHGRNRKG